MAVSWVYQKLVLSHLNKPSFCSDKDKINESLCGPNFDKAKNLDKNNESLCCLNVDKTKNLNKNNESLNGAKFNESNSLEPLDDLTNQWKDAPIFQKKRVYYFSPTYFSKDESSTMKRMYKFYLNTSYEYNSSSNADINYYSVTKRCEDERNDTYFEDKTSLKKYASNRTDLEKKLSPDLTKLHCASPITSQVLDTLHYYLIFPFCVSKKVFDGDNIGYHCSKCLKKSNPQSPNVDIYSVDDQTFENLCLQEVEENSEKTPCSLLPADPKLETDESGKNDNSDQKYDFLSSVVHEPYYSVVTETNDCMNTSDLYRPTCITKFIGDEMQYVDPSFKDAQVDKTDNSQVKAEGMKFKSSFHTEEYDFSLCKLFRKLMAMNQKLRDMKSKRIFDQ